MLDFSGAGTSELLILLIENGTVDSYRQDNTGTETVNGNLGHFQIGGLWGVRG